ncbi:uncharacterized protein LOC141642789 [Silene latifolia]|uniref:uncharacterized protein LOC141642789 n=1 Tax=Silene latifolia TaxID=37657 RepID=UPI003D77A589
MADKRYVLNDYERVRNERMAKNKIRLQEAGILQLVNSMKTLGDCSKNKKRKAKDKTVANQKDTEYNLNNNSGSDEEFDPLNFESVSKKVIHSGGRKQVRLTPNNSISVKQRHQRRSQTEFSERNGDGDVERVSLRQKLTEKNVTMGDILLRRKQLHGGDKAIDKQVATNSSSSRRSQEELEEHHDDHEGTDYEKECGLKDDGNDIDTGFDGETSSHSDYEDSDEYDDEINTEDEDEQVNLDNEDLELEATMKEKTRGPTMLHHIHTRPLEKRKSIILNEFGQPVGPITEKKDTVGEFSRFLGTIGRDYKFAPLVIDNWRKVPNKEKMWEYVLLKYMVPAEGKDWVIKTIGSAWRVHKCRFKRKHYYSYSDDKSRWQNRSKTVPDEDFLKLLSKWKKKAEKMRCSRNKDHRLSQRNMHTIGAKSFAVVREKMRNEHPTKEAPSLAEVFERTRKRNEGKKYNDSYDDTAKKIEDMKHYVAPRRDGSGPSDAYFGVMGKGYDGFCRLYGRGVSNKKLKAVNGNTSYVVPGEIVESLKASLIKDIREDMDSRINEKHKQLEEEHLKKMTELETNQRELDAERENMTQDILHKLLEKLPPEIVKQYLYERA